MRSTKSHEMTRTIFRVSSCRFVDRSFKSKPTKFTELRETITLDYRGDDLADAALQFAIVGDG